MIEQNTIIGGLLFIGLAATLGFTLWSSCWPKKVESGTYESEEQKQPWNVAETPDTDPRATYEDVEAANNWQYVTEVVGQNVPAKRADDPLDSDLHVVEQNESGVYRSRPKEEWLEDVRSETEVLTIDADLTEEECEEIERAIKEFS